MSAVVHNFINNRIALIIIFVLMLNSAIPVHATTAYAPGSLDPTFDGDGLVSTTMGADGYSSTGQAVLVQPDGKIIVAGDADHMVHGGVYSEDFALVRYNSDGSLDTSFDTDGKVTTDFGNYHDSAYALALQPDGKIVAVGTHFLSIDGSDDEFILARYNSDGSLDTSFDEDGKVILDLGGSYEILEAVAIQPDGKIVVVGDTKIVTGNYDIAVIRYNSDGSLDTTFDGDGIVTTAIGSKSEHGKSIAIQPDGKIIVGGTTNNGIDTDFALVRYNSDGSLDTSFSTDGIATLDFGLQWDGYIALQPDGKILIAGHGSDGVLLARYNSDGTLDTSFDADRLVMTYIDGTKGIRDIALDRNGKIVLAGYKSFGTNSTGYDFALLRYNPDGSLDTSFGTDGKVFTDFGSAHPTSIKDELAFSVDLQSDGKIVAAGYRYVEGAYGGVYYQIAVARYVGDTVIPEIQVLDESIDIPDNAGTVSFGSSPVNTPVVKTFTVKNTGAGTLTLTEPISLPSGFSLVSGFGSLSLAPAASTTFKVKLDAVMAGNYSGQVSFGNNDADENPFNFTISGTIQAATLINFSIGGVDQGTYPTQNSSLQRSFAATLGGPVKVTSTNGERFVTSQRVVFGNSFNELMGYPADQFTTEYWFPWYDGVYMNTWILVGNPSSTQTAYVDIYIGGVKKNPGGVPYAIPPGDRVTPQFTGVLDGPVRVVSVTGAGTSTPLPIFASERSTYLSSFNEVMGYAADLFTTEYWFPWYDQVYMNSWILVGNPSSTQMAYVDIYIGGVKQNNTPEGIPYAIPPSGNITPQFPNVVDGPVRVVSTTGSGTSTPLPIFASERSTYQGSFNEVMGFPANQFTRKYWFPWYQHNTGGMTSWLLVGNPSTTQTAYVDIYIAGLKQNSTYIIPSSGSIIPQFNLSNGPVQVVSVTGAGTSTPINIFTSERTLYGPSFNEVMGYPADQLSSEYWFPWYDSVYMATDLVVGVP